MLKTNALFKASRGLNLGHHRIDCIEVCGGANFGGDDQIYALLGIMPGYIYLQRHVGIVGR